MSRWVCCHIVLLVAPWFVLLTILNLGRLFATSQDSNAQEFYIGEEVAEKPEEERCFERGPNSTTALCELHSLWIESHQTSDHLWCSMASAFIQVEKRNLISNYIDSTTPWKLDGNYLPSPSPTCQSTDDSSFSRTIMYKNRPNAASSRF